MGFEAEWLAARRPYDDAALDRDAVRSIQAWAAALPVTPALTVVDLGSGTGAALYRIAYWLAPRVIDAYAVEADSMLSEHLLTDEPVGIMRHLPTVVTPLGSDVLAPLDHLGGPADGTVDLVLGHALADLLPLDRLAGRVAALLRPGGLAHLALTYDGLTELAAAAGSGFPDPDLDERVVAAFHRQMDRPRAADPTYGGSTAGRRLAPALTAAGLAIMHDVPSVWQVQASDGPAGRAVLDRLIRYVIEAARDDGAVPEGDLESWERRRRAALVEGRLAARVGHRDVLARKPEPPDGARDKRKAERPPRADRGRP